MHMFQSLQLWHSLNVASEYSPLPVSLSEDSFESCNIELPFSLIDVGRFVLNYVEGRGEGASVSSKFFFFHIDGSDVADRDGNPEAVGRFCLKSQIPLSSQFKIYFALDNMDIPAIKVEVVCFYSTGSLNFLAVFKDVGCMLGASFYALSVVFCGNWIRKTKHPKHV